MRSRGWDPQNEINDLMRRDTKQLSLLLSPLWKVDSHLVEAEPGRELLPETDHGLDLHLGLDLGLVASRTVRK